MAKHRLFDARRRQGWSYEMARSSRMFHAVWRGRIHVSTGLFDGHLTQFRVCDS